ncbi:MAG TPA: MFS transporter [Alphaproteobacteria bacterium]|nr:MFS transporter [Alphaproteobacteria bacterium]
MVSRVSEDTAPPVAAGAESFAVSTAYRRYVVGLLLAVGVFNFIDRQIFSVLLESIKRDLALSDTELGLLGGLAFSIFYVSVGIPIAWLADRFNRRNIMAMAITTWSGMTALCGLATGFGTLFIARVGVGVGEAGSGPPSQSLIADYIPPKQRGGAMAILGLNLPLGILLGFLFGGWIGQYFGWRAAFYVVGIPSILLAILVRLTLREPPRGHVEQLKSDGPTPPIFASLKYFLSRPTFRHLPLGAALYTLAAWGQLTWLPAFFIRVHGMSGGEAGTWLAFIIGIGGAISVIVGGFLSDRMARRTGDDRWYPWISGLSVVVSLPFAFVIFLSASPYPALGCLIVTTLLSQTWIGPVNAMIQGVAGVRRRALASAMFYFLINLVSYGIGPLIIGAASDLFTPLYGAESLRYSLLVLTLVFQAWSAVHFFLAARSVREDLAAARSAAGAESL